MSKTPQTFKIGDRVAERPKATIIPGLRTEVQERISKYKGQRYGEVVGLVEKTSKARNGKMIRQKFLKILWDGTQTPCDHAQMRICHERDLTRVRDEYCTALGE
jgi:hypothetical protein